METESAGMGLAHPQVRELLATWQAQLRQLTGNDTLLLTAFNPPEQTVDFGRIAEVVCEATGIPLDWVRGKSRKRETVLTRHLIAYYACQYSDMTLKEIGQSLGGKDHTTVLHARERVLDLLETGDKIACTVVTKINQRICN